MGSQDAPSVAAWAARQLTGMFKTAGWLGIALGLFLLLLLRLTLPQEKRGTMRAPAFLLGAHVILRLVTGWVEEGSLAREPLVFLQLLTLLLSIGRSGFVLALDVVVGRRLGRPLPTIIRDILQGLVYAAVAIVTLKAVGVDTGSLLTTSALLTAVVGLSLQDTLGNVFAGLAIQAQQPFQVGDWIQFTDGNELTGRVVEINWRATRVITLDEVEVVIPNGMLSKAPIRNYTKPTPLSRRSVFVQGPYEVPPTQVKEAILAGLRDVDGVTDHPPPSVVLKSFDDSGMTYWVRFFIRDFQRGEAIDGEVRDRVWYALHRAGISVPFPIRTLHTIGITDLHDAARERLDARRITALSRVELFSVLPPDAVAQLAASSLTRLYAPGENIIEQGSEGDELFVIERGSVTVILRSDEGKVEEQELARLSRGDFFGEMSLMTGASRAASVRALTEVAVVIVDKMALAPILDRNPELAEEMSQMLAARQERLMASASVRPSDGRPAMSDRSGQLLEKIRDFFSL